MAANRAEYRDFSSRDEQLARELQRAAKFIHSGIAIELFSLRDFTRFHMSYGPPAQPYTSPEKVSAPLERSGSTWHVSAGPPTTITRVHSSSSPPPQFHPPPRKYPFILIVN